jgi:hypothetical protein
MWLGALYEVVLHWLLADKPVPISQIAPNLRLLLLRSVGADHSLLQEGKSKP